MTAFISAVCPVRLPGSYSIDDADADADGKAQVAGLIDRLGFFGIDLGSLALGAQFVRFLSSALSALNLVKFD